MGYIQELFNEDEVSQAFEVVKQLRTHLTKDEYLDLVTESIRDDGYRMFGMFESTEIVGIVAFQAQTTLHHGRSLWVTDLVVDEAWRSKDIGARLLSYLENWADEQGYSNMMLSSSIDKSDAQQFFEGKMNYSKVSYVFKKSLK
ncbi:GNAT family N-acetyltransferase [Staphylococcus sp. SQ8-PEA]|uniref:GNAT family N-acetyltransferase n=1 Tax=Staphylococcus marylandisciuri TaxID=2981529 RepID=A0ABT2QMV6_9STAP|nr:GNAT family N-acetyltransferase [Staphylococcus marylandisciuri]MCU5745321.1 GNAT family N-acetyltransferase [Staphylococcus marylandisciuri]